MTDTDYNGFPIKVGHTQDVAAPPLGPCVYVLERYDGKVYGAWSTRHDAVAARRTYFFNVSKEEWFDVRYVPVGSIRLEDMIAINKVEENNE